MVFNLEPKCIAELSRSLAKFVDRLFENGVISLHAQESQLPSFWKDTQANVAVMFGIALVPIATAMGMAVDYSRANSARTAMQAALDGAALMIAKDAAGMSPGEVSSRAQGYFNALVTRPELYNVAVTASYNANTGNGSSIEMTASGRINTHFLNLIGFPSLNLNVNSSAAWGNTRLRVALALDATGSMAEKGKMPAMQAAAKKLVDQLAANAKSPGDLYISMIPFSTHVNVGPANYQQPWLDWNEWEEENGDCNGGGGKTRSKCLSKGNTWTPSNHSTWNGCITDRDEDYDVKNSPPVISSPPTLFQPEQYVPCPTQLVPLTVDWAKIKTSIDLISPGGPTNQPVGMAWAWLIPHANGSVVGATRGRRLRLQEDHDCAQRRLEHEEQEVRQRLHSLDLCRRASKTAV